MRPMTLLVFLAAVVWLGSPVPGQAASPASEIDAVRQAIDALRTQYESQIKDLQERLRKLEESSSLTAAPSPVPAVAMQAQPVVPQAPGEREITFPKDTPAEALGLPRLEIFGTRIGGFLVGSFSYNSALQIVPEVAGGAAALADPGRTNFRFDKFGLNFSRVFSHWLSAGAAIEVENHRDRHSHLITPTEATRRGCPPGRACERFGAEAAEVTVSLDKFHITAIAPVGNGLAFSLGRFDVPFGLERHDEVSLLQATTSEVFQFGRPQKVTGLQVAYTFAPWMDVVAYAANRWESENTGEDDFNDNNSDKTFGARMGFTLFPQERLLNVGVGGFFGPERADRNAPKRWVVDLDFTWSPTPRLLLGGEFIYGGESKVTMRQRGEPVARGLEVRGVHWRGLYTTIHYDLLDWLGVTGRYGLFDDMNGGRTGVKQVLQSFTFAPVFHLSTLIPQLRPMGVTYPRTRHPIHWVDLKLEYRLNRSNQPVFGAAQPNVALFDKSHQTSHQLQLQGVANF